MLRKRGSDDERPGQTHTESDPVNSALSTPFSRRILDSMSDQKVNRVRILLRGLFIRCPVCGERHIRRGLHLAERCPRCEFRFERREGQFVGAVGVNTIVSFALLAIVLVVGAILTWPDIQIIPMIVASLAVSVLFPLLFLPVSRSLWTAIDLAMDPLQPGEAPGLETDHVATTSDAVRGADS